MGNLRKVYLISDSTGELAERFTNAIVSQFPNDSITLKKFNFVERVDEAEKIILKLSKKDGVLFHTVMSKDLKAAIERLSRKKGLPSFDLTGPPADFMVKHLQVKPVWDVKTIHRINEAYERRIDAIEFTTAHDDGTGRSTWSDADVILVGPSRTSKTPTSIYLAMKGYRVANIAIFRSMTFIEDLETLKGDRRVIGFLIDIATLRDIRLRRASELGTVPRGYTEADEIEKEIRTAKKIYQQFQWKILDVTDRAIEETAALIIRQTKTPDT